MNDLRYFHRPPLHLACDKHSWTAIQLSNMQDPSRSIRTKSDLTGQYGDVVLFEYSEQYPTLLNEVGMFSRIRTYLRPVTLDDHTFA
jgi:glutathionylspermidine synthase